MRTITALGIFIWLAPLAQAASIPDIMLPPPPLPLPASTPFPQPARARLLPLIQAEALRQGVPPALADAVAMVETGYTEGAVGTSGEIGLMQIMPSTALLLGFNQTMDKLFDPATNIHFGVAYLARAWAASGGNACRALMKYRAGVGEEAYSPLSIKYCQRASAWLAVQNSPLGVNVAQNTPASPNASDPYVITLAGRPPLHPDLASFAAVVDIPGTIIERPVHLARHQIAGSRAAAVMAEIQDSNTDPHVIHIPASDP